MRVVSIFIVFSLLLGSCNIDDVSVKGNGKKVSRNFDYKDFHEIDVNGAKSLIIKQDSNFSVRVETDENLFDHIHIAASDGKLRVDTKKSAWMRPTNGVKVFVSMPQLNRLQISGSSDVKTEGRFIQNEKLYIELNGASSGNIDLRIPDIRLHASGASTIIASGEARDLEVDLSGASTFEGFSLKAENTKVDVSGASKADVFASVSLKAEASGASNVRYKGKPSVKQSSSGASDVRSAE